MSKLRCQCGHIIVDQTDYLPYKARFVPDEDEDADLQTVAGNILQFMLAREHGEQGIIHEQVGDARPDDEDPITTLYMLVAGAIMRSGRRIYECENCGRLWVQKHAEYGKNVFACYAPEGEERGVLSSQHRRKNTSESED
jgi:hypothetical protein